MSISNRSGESIGLEIAFTILSNSFRARSASLKSPLEFEMQTLALVIAKRSVALDRYFAAKVREKVTAILKRLEYPAL